jgi:hypothetical protein
MQMSRRAAIAVLFAGLLWGAAGAASANDRTILAGCVTARTDSSVTLHTSGDEQVTVDTTWLKPTMQDTLTADCLTFTTLRVDGRFVAESVEAGDEPNEVHSITAETTADRPNKR